MTPAKLSEPHQQYFLIVQPIDRDSSKSRGLIN